LGGGGASNKNVQPLHHSLQGILGSILVALYRVICDLVGINVGDDLVGLLIN